MSSPPATPHGSPPAASPHDLRLKLKLTFITWLGLYPTVTLLNVVLEPWLHLMVLPLRTLVVTAIAVTVVRFVTFPRLSRLFAGWLGHS